MPEAQAGTGAPGDQVLQCVFRAELEGLGLLPVFLKLLEGWQAQGYELVSLGGLLESIDASRLPRHEVVRGKVAGRAGSLMLQGPEFLAAM